MPIEFTCSGCKGLLRVPDTAAGKKAQCPTCQAVLDVPTASEPAESPESGNPFAERPAVGPTGDQNPYASPFTAEPTWEPAQQGELTQRRIGFELVERSFNMLKAQLGPCVLYGLIFVGISIGSGIVGTIIETGSAVGGFEAQIGGIIARNIWEQLVTAFTTGMSILFGLAVWRGNTSPLSVMFNVSPHYLKLLGFAFLCLLVIALAAGVAGAPMLLAWGGTVDEEIAIIISAGLAMPLVVVFSIVGLSIYLTTCFIVDRGEGVFQAIQSSFRFMNGNRLIVLGMMIVTGIVGALFVGITCGIGAIFVLPYFSLLAAAIYLQATGQRMVTPAGAGPPGYRPRPQGQGPIGPPPGFNEGPPQIGPPPGYSED